MPTQLYSANLFDSAMPVNPPQTKKGKKPIPSLEPTPKPEKKERTPAQIAAQQKMQEARKAKKEALAKAREEEIAQQQKQAEEDVAKFKALEEKKIQQAAKRKAAREAKKALATPPDSEATESVPSIDAQVEEALAEPPAKKEKKRKIPVEDSDDGPPAWFKKYISGVKKEENKERIKKKPRKEVEEEVEEVAHKSWGDGLVRDRLRNEVDGHMNRMYGMIFGQRRLH